MQQRGSDRFSPQRDDEMKHELQGMLRGDHATRAAEWHDPEPPAEDDIEPSKGGPVPPPGSDREREEEDQAFRFDLARHLRRSAFPAAREDLLRVMEETNAPDRLVTAVRGLPSGDTYANVQEVSTALGHRPRA